MYVSMAPEDPIKEPTMVNRLLLSMKPSATRAQPEYEFNTVIATGISAAPMLLVIFQPSTELVIAHYVKLNTPNGIQFGLANIPIMQSALNPVIGRLRYSQ